MIRTERMCGQLNGGYYCNYEPAFDRKNMASMSKRLGEERKAANICLTSYESSRFLVSENASPPRDMRTKQVPVQRF